MQRLTAWRPHCAGAAIARPGDRGNSRFGRGGSRPGMRAAAPFASVRGVPGQVRALACPVGVAHIPRSRRSSSSATSVACACEPGRAGVPPNEPVLHRRRLTEARFQTTAVPRVLPQREVIRQTAQRVLDVTGARITEDPANGVVADGTVTNRSKVAQASLLVFAVARRGSAIVGAGRAIVSQLASGAAGPFQASLVGHALGARLTIFAAPADLR
jgi:hypothetical protein